mgnify:CR=1 FL=1
MMLIGNGGLSLNFLGGVYIVPNKSSVNARKPELWFYGNRILVRTPTIQ